METDLTEKAPRASSIDVGADIERFAAMGLLPTLLADHSTGGNIIWASSVFVDKGDSYAPTDEILATDISGLNAGLIRTRASKAKEAQTALTRAHAEVFTPTWVVKLMVDAADKAWWESHEGATWQDYVLSRRLEITCGEAPYLVSRYDAADGAPVPIDERVGILDRKLRLVSEHTTARKTWVKYAHMALKSTYGYEFQGDNLLIARVNVLATLEDYAREEGYELPLSTYRKFATAISWNLWQMDGLTDDVPITDRRYVEGDPYGETLRFPGFDEWYASAGNVVIDSQDSQDVTRALVCDWNKCEVVAFAELKREGSDMKFDYVIGNPPYQEESRGANANDTPIYHYFYEGAFSVSDRVELISPARFLFEAGGTPDWWNRKMLDDPHVKVIHYAPRSSEIFPQTNITAGIAIVYRDLHKAFDPIGVFTPYMLLNSIVQKVAAITSTYMDHQVTNRGLYRYSDLVYDEHPDEMRRTADRRIAPSCFERMPLLFTETKPNDDHDYIRIYGVIRPGRGYRWFRRDYVKHVDNLDMYKTVISKADGAAGTIGNPVPARVCGRPEVLSPGVGFTETFISIGCYESEYEAMATAQYIKTKFARAMLGVLKVTQNNARPTWARIPLQDFTPNSDIDWSKSVSEIDDQLFEKYGLEDDEIAFIKFHVKEMS